MTDKTREENMSEAMEVIRDALDTHDIDDYAEVDGPDPETGIYCIECGWRVSSNGRPTFI